MVDNRLLDYIDSTIGRGYPPARIREHLIKSGWKPAEVDAAIGIAKEEMHYSEPEPEGPVKKKGGSGKKKVAVVLVALVAVLLIVLVFILPLVFPSFSVLDLFTWGISPQPPGGGIISGHNFRGNGLLKLDILNRMEDAVEISSVSVNSGSGEGECSGYTIPTVVYPDSSKGITIDCNSLEKGPGDSYSLRVTVDYKTGSTPYRETETISGVIS